MGMTTVVRRAASRVVPLAARAFQANTCSNYHSSALSATFNLFRTPDLASVLFKNSSPSPVRSFSSQPDSDKLLFKTLGEEIGRVETDPNLAKVEEEEEVPGDFPFKIEDHPGKQIVTLTSEYEDEQITVQVRMPSGVTGEYNKYLEHHKYLERSDDQLPLVVRISKYEGLCLEFACTAIVDKIFIDSMSVNKPNSTTDDDRRRDLFELGEYLHNGFLKYLEMKGIKPSTTNYLHKYMLRKDRREYEVWLKNAKKFLEL